MFELDIREFFGVDVWGVSTCWPSCPEDAAAQVSSYGIGPVGSVETAK